MAVSASLRSRRLRCGRRSGRRRGPAGPRRTSACGGRRWGRPRQPRSRVPGPWCRGRVRISETLTFSTDCYRPGFLRIRRQISAKAHREDCVTRFVPLKHRAEGDYRDIPLPAFLAAEIDTHLQHWPPVAVDGIEVLFAPRDRGKGVMPTATTYGYHFTRALKAAGIVRPDGTAKYTPHSLRHFFASTALAHGIPLHEVSRWLGHRSIKTTADVYGLLVPESWDRCRTIMHNALRSS